MITTFEEIRKAMNAFSAQVQQDTLVKDICPAIDGIVIDTEFGKYKYWYLSGEVTKLKHWKDRT